MSFSKQFVWGAAAASYQVEGGWDADGKGPSVWDMFSHQPGKVYNGDTGDVACDHYHRYAEDVALMKSIGLHAYRLSIGWPRVLPDGTGAVNEVGLAYYDRLIDALLAANITPYVTLFHWDYPYALFCRGGWLNPDSSRWFADYTSVIVNRLGDRVRHWMPLNEMPVFVDVGHREGRHAPGLKMAEADVLRMAHNVLLSHGRAVQAIRAGAKLTPQVGTANVSTIAMPLDKSSQADINAAREWMFSVKQHGVWSHAFWADPIFKGDYPADTVERFGAAMPEIAPGDMAIIHQPLDFLGFNVYQGIYVRAGAGGQPEVAPVPVGAPLTQYHWRVTPEALYWGPKFLYERYGLPIYITENGLSSPDWVSMDGKVHDPQRIDFLRRYLLQYRRAAADGVDLAGYFQWSIMDNFEWAEGMKHRFGLVHVDYQTQKRTLKDSALWYRDIIASNGASLDK